MNYYNDYYYRTPAPYSPPMTPMPVIEQYSMPENIKTAVSIIKESLAGEKEDELFYEYLISKAPSEEDKVIIRSIRDDERKHFAMLKELYTQLTGKIPPPPEEPVFEKPAAYLTGIQKALFGELKAVERYRKLLFNLTKRKDINAAAEILTDELKHASKYNFLYSKNKDKRR